MKLGKQKENTEQTEAFITFRLFCYFRLVRILPVFIAGAWFAGAWLVLGQTAHSQKAPTVAEDGSKLLLGDRVLLDDGKDGFMSVKQIKPAPGGKRFSVIACGFECTDNEGFVFNADGTGKRKFTSRWNSILQDKLEWSADGQKLYYFRINSTAAEPPANVPAEGWVEIDVTTGRKTMATSRRLKTEASYATFHASSEDSTLNLREAPSPQAKIIRKFNGNIQGIRFTGQTRKIGRTVWVKIKYEDASGWVNQNYLYEESLTSKQ